MYPDKRHPCAITNDLVVVVVGAPADEAARVLRVQGHQEVVLEVHVRLLAVDVHATPETWESIVRTKVAPNLINLLPWLL